MKGKWLIILWWAVGGLIRNPCMFQPGCLTSLWGRGHRTPAAWEPDSVWHRLPWRLVCRLQTQLRSRPDSSRRWLMGASRPWPNTYQGKQSCYRPCFLFVLRGSPAPLNCFSEIFNNAHVNTCFNIPSGRRGLRVQTIYLKFVRFVWSFFIVSLWYRRGTVALCFHSCIVMF